jgi:hypothetical protein
MADNYLILAHQILKLRSRPMSAQEILSDAERFDKLPEHLHGATMVKTLQARIAEDIDKKRKRSDFYRTGQGTYFLRVLSNDPTLHQTVLGEFSPPKRKKPFASDRLLFVKIKSHQRDFGRIGEAEFRKMSGRNSGYYPAGKEPAGFYSVSTFSSITFEDKILCFEVGRHTNFPDQIGETCVGFRSLIDEFDLDLFVDDELGFTQNATREVMHNIALGDAAIDDREVRGKAKLLFIAQEEHVSRVSLVLHFDLTGVMGFDGRLVARHGVTKPRWLERHLLSQTDVEAVSQIALLEL